MTPESLLAHVESLGVTLTVDEGRLRVSAPRGSLTEELKTAIAGARERLLALLQQRVVRGITRIDRSGPLPLSSFQERLWILHRMDPQNVAYNVGHGWKNSPGADAASVIAAIQALVLRHEILRSSFDEVNGSLAARLLAPEAVTIELRDITALPDGEKRPRMESDLQIEVRKPFDLRGAAPVRFFVYRLTASETATVLVAHHIAVDDWSLALIEREIAGPSVSAAPRLQYADYSAWQRATVDSQALAADLDWWSRTLAGVPQLSAFPPDLSPAEKPVGAVRVFQWSSELASQVRSLARKEGATLYMALLAACAVALRWHTGQEDFVFGSPLGARENPELESLIGPFVNVLLVRVDVREDPTFGTMLRRTRDAMLSAHEHRQVPFEVLLDRLKPVRSLDHTPLYQIAIVQHNAAAASEGSQRMGGGAMHELTWFVRDLPAGLECVFEYRADLYSPAAIDRVAAHLETVFRRAIEVETRRASELAVLPEAELRQMMQSNATAAPTPATVFPTSFEQRAALSPESPALAFAGAVLSYGELNRQANRLALHLRARGVTSGCRVALCLERSAALVIALLAIQKAGAAYVPLDPGFPGPRLSYMLADSGSTFLLVQGTNPVTAELPVEVTVLDLEAGELQAAGPDTNLPQQARPEDPAYVIYTSGSTGTPKGVIVSHASLMNLLDSLAREPGLAAQDVLAAVTTVSFDIAGLELYLPLLVGARIELVDRETAADGFALAEFLGARGVTVLQGTPATWRLLVEAGWRGLPGFRGFCGGEALSRELVSALDGRLTELWNLYGPTETTVWSTVERVRPDADITIGHPIANTRILIADEHGTARPIGAPGEIWIGGLGVAVGYHNRPELTAQRFVTLTGGPYPGRFYRTGDLGRWRNDGRLECLGRLDHQVKIRGFRVEPGEIESALAAHEAVRHAVVVAHDAGLSDRRLVAYIVYQPGEDLTVSEVRRHLRGRLPDYMIPALVVAIDSVPLTPNGKVDRAALPDPFRNASETSGYEPPVSDMEYLLAQVWAEVLKVERVGANDNFFELGGHSLLSLRVASLVRSRSGWQMDPRTLFFHTLRQIAAAGSVARERELHGV